MKVGVQTGFSGATSRELIAAFGGIVEERGFHSIWVPEQVIFFREYASRYPYSDTGRIPGGSGWGHGTTDRTDLPGRAY